MSDQQFERAVDDWLEDGSDRTPRRAIDGVLLAIKTTPQERDLRIPWRFPQMLAASRATGFAAVAIVAVVGVGALFYVTSNRPGSVGSQGTPAPMTSPPVALTPAPSEVAPGIAGWTTYTSEVYGFGMGYPADWSVNGRATRKWQAGDRFPDDVLSYADSFTIGEDDAAIGLLVWEMPAGEGADIESFEGLKAWAQTFCNDVVASACDTFTDQAVSMYRGGGCSCPGAILVPTEAGPQYAFFNDWGSLIRTSAPDEVRVVVIGRPDSFPGAAPYGGSVELLKSVLTTMDVWTPGQQPGS
jgi:hypothetical protein